MNVSHILAYHMSYTASFIAIGAILIDILLDDGTWRTNITGEDLGYPAEEIASVIQGATDFVTRRPA